LKNSSNMDSLIEAEMTAKGDSVGEVLKGLQSHFGDVQIVARSVNSRALSFSEQTDGKVKEFVRQQVIARRCGKVSTGFQVAEQLNLDELIAQMENAPRIPSLPAGRPSSDKHAAGLDLRLHRTLADDEVFEELSGSMRSNVLHEAQRCGLEAACQGNLNLWRQITFVGSGTELTGAFQGALDAHIVVNDLLGDRLAQVHAPESFLPIALVGARCLQRYGGLPAIDGHSLTSVPKVVLHPRALETALRAFQIDSIRATLLQDPEIVACDGLFLVDDPTIEGLWTARGFDDTGKATARQALVLRGQVAKRMLSIDAPGQEWFGNLLDGQAGMPRSGFSGILVGRGESSLQEMLVESRMAIIVNEWKVVSVPGQAQAFTAEVAQGVLMRGEQPVGLIRPGTLQLNGSLFGREGAMFSGGRLSRELQDTGSAVAPFVETSLKLHR
jgi:hypothetical protein